MRKHSAEMTGIIVLLLAIEAKAYEVASHAEITYRAHGASVMAGGDFSKDFGLYGVTGQLTLPRRYWDIASGGEKPRGVDQPTSDPKRHESNVIADVRHDGVVDEPLGWLLRGVIREDDIGPVVDERIARLRIENPFDDPYFPRLVRPLNHFFDPAKNGVGLVGFPPIDGTPLPAPDWMLGVTDTFGAATPDSSRRNHFSIRDAREAQWRMLTGTRADGTSIETQERVSYVTTMFRALGDSLHLIQDMAQPQHTRNDTHGAGSVYEDRIDMRVRGKALKRLVLPPISLAPLDFGACNDGLGFCPVMLNRYADYFSTSINSVAAGKGMADYSNRGFFSEGTSLGNNTYALPSNTIGDYQQVGATNEFGNPITLLAGDVPDNVFATEAGVKLAGLSAWDDSLNEIGAPRKTQIYIQNYDEQARLLIPRAVAYSAGILNYFFRGTIDINLPAEQVFAVADFKGNQGFKYLKASVKNSTPPINGAAQNTGNGGKLYAVINYRRNKCAVGDAGYPTLSGWPRSDSTNPLIWDESCRDPSPDGKSLPYVTVSGGVAVPSTFDTAFTDVVFDFSTPLPFDALDVDLRIVYRGPLGQEDDAIAIGWERYVSEPNFLDFQNNLDCRGPCDPAISNCQLTASVKLPFWNAVDEPGWRPVAAVTDLMPGQYGRVAFLTHEGYRLGVGSEIAGEVLTNQNYPFDATVQYPDGTQQLRPPGITIRAPFFRTRNVTQGGALYSWMVYGDQYNGDNCPAPIDPSPQAVTIMFP